jgi:glycogen phosphorylase
LNTAANDSRSGNSSESIKQGFLEHLKYTLGVDEYTTTDHDRFMALSYTIRDRLINQWIKTQQTHHNKNTKRAYYLSLEFLMGRAMGNNIINLQLKDTVSEVLTELGYSLEDLEDQEADAGLGNGGLGRLAACFLDSMATMNLPSFGYGIRYDYGIFKQKIDNGYQTEQPDDWLRNGNPWEIERPDVAVKVSFGGRVESYKKKGKIIYSWVDTNDVMGVAYDMPIAGYGGITINTLRLWSARAAEEFDFQDFNDGDYVEAVSAKVQAENLTKVLYPNDTLYLGKELRLKQQYFFVACSLSDIIRRFRKSGTSWKNFPDFAAIQLNDTHPSIAIPELMRLLIDEENLSWDKAWGITVSVMGYTNHTLMPEALEKWPEPMLAKLLPRHLQIIFEINRRFLNKAITFFPDDKKSIQKISIVEEGNPKQIRMANLCITGSHSTNGVAALHTELLKSRLVPSFAKIFPGRFNNKTNGITQRRWLLHANPALAALITETIGDGWIIDFAQLRKLEIWAEDKKFRAKFQETKNLAKNRLSEYVDNQYGLKLNPEAFFNVQIKRMHEYKRQLLNIMQIIMLYNRIRKGNPNDYFPRISIFAGKSAPGYEMAKLIIKLINNVSGVINTDESIKRKIEVYFLPDYKVSLAEKIIPATDLSEQISTAGTEASGTGNMKFMCNGAITIGTMDGANVEIVHEAGIENEFIFGLSADEVSELKPTYNPKEYYLKDPEIKEALDMIFNNYFSFSEPGIFEPLRRMLLEDGDKYMHLADLRSYDNAHQSAALVYKNRDDWNKKAIINIASSGKFSSDRTIAEYAKDIWGLKPCPVE